DKLVTGVQTCALPILRTARRISLGRQDAGAGPRGVHLTGSPISPRSAQTLSTSAARSTCRFVSPPAPLAAERTDSVSSCSSLRRSEERRVGEECRCER